MNGKNYYEILGLRYDCTQEEIRAAYKALALKVHPDHNSGNKQFNELFKLINEAYETLSNPGKRIRYDSELNCSGFMNSEKSKPKPFLKINIVDSFSSCFALIVLLFVMCELYFPFFYKIVDSISEYQRSQAVDGKAWDFLLMESSEASFKLKVILLINLVLILSLSQVFSRGYENLETFLENWEIQKRTSRIVFISQVTIIIQCIIILALSLFFGVNRFYIYDLIIMLVFQSYLLYQGKIPIW